MSDTTTHEVFPTRTVDGHVLPAPGASEINPGHTDVAFIGRRFMVTKIRGTFTDVTGTGVIASHLDDSKIEITHQHDQRRVRQPSTRHTRQVA